MTFVNPPPPPTGTQRTRGAAGLPLGGDTLLHNALEVSRDVCDVLPHVVENIVTLRPLTHQPQGNLQPTIVKGIFTLRGNGYLWSHDLSRVGWVSQVHFLSGGKYSEGWLLTSLQIWDLPDRVGTHPTFHYWYLVAATKTCTGSTHPTGIFSCWM